MSKEKQISEELKQKYEDSIYDEVKYGIITALQWYGPANLKKLSQLVDRPETTTIRYLKQLLAEKLIDVDAEKTATSWGKFYQLSDEAKTLASISREKTNQRGEEVMTELMNHRGKSEEETRQLLLNEILNKEDPEKVVLGLKSNIAIIHNIQKVIINDFITNYSELEELKEEKGKDYLKENLIIEPADILLTTDYMHYSKAQHLLRFYEAFINFQLELIEMKKELDEEMDRENVPEDQRKLISLHLFMGASEFKFHLRDQKK